MNHIKTNKEIGNRIKERRELLKMSQEELARKVGYTSRTTIVKIEKGENMLRQSKLLSFAKALDCNPIWLAGLSESKDNLCVPKDNLDLTIFNDEGIEHIFEYYEFLKTNKKFLK